jgi:phenylacetate-CoA ligase
VESKDGLHVWEDHFYPEVIDPITGDVLPEGEQGELVFTSLTKEAMPVIRYRTRDLTRLLPGTARPGMRRMEKVTGRTDDMIILRGVNLFPTQIEEVVLRTPGLSPHFALELTTRGRMDHLICRVEARADCPSERRAVAASEVTKGVKDMVGCSIDVLVVDPETLPRSLAGKLQRLVDHRNLA